MALVLALTIVQVAWQHGIINKQVNKSKYNVKAKHRFRRWRSVGEFDIGKEQNKEGIQSLAYDNMLGTSARLQRIQYDMEQNLKHQMNMVNMHCS